MAFVFGENIAGGVLAGVSLIVIVLVLAYVNTGKVKRWTIEERRIEENYRNNSGQDENAG